MDHVPVARRTDTCHLDARSGPAARVWGFSAAGGPERWGRCWPVLRASCYLNISINIKRPQTVIFSDVRTDPSSARRGQDERAVSRRPAFMFRIAQSDTQSVWKHILSS